MWQGFLSIFVFELILWKTAMFGKMALWLSPDDNVLILSTKSRHPKSFIAVVTVKMANITSAKSG